MTERWFPGPMPEIQILWGYGYGSSFRIEDEQIAEMDLDLRLGHERGPWPIRGLMEMDLSPAFQLRPVLHLPPPTPAPPGALGAEADIKVLHFPLVPALPGGYARIICLKAWTQVNTPMNDLLQGCKSCSLELECLMDV